MKKMMLICLSLLLCVTCVGLFAACQNNTEDDLATAGNSATAGKTPAPATDATPDATADTTETVPEATTPAADETTAPAEETTAPATDATTATATPKPATPTPTKAPAGISGTVAHWKFQNDSKYFSGSLNGTNLKITDLSGNGNTLEVKTEGNGGGFDVFSWDSGSTLKSGGSSALRFGNTYAAAKNVTPSDYKASDMTYTGGTYVSGKYFSTVSNAPINTNNFENGYTIEAIFKVDNTFNNNYNRYAGIFSRQGLMNNEPWFSLALAESNNTAADGSLKGNLGLQLVQSAKGSYQVDVNVEYGFVEAGQWVHYMAVCESSGQITLYVNGAKVGEAVCGSIGSTAGKKYGWDVGAGRKDFNATQDTTKNTNYEEGGIRRLFCGTISEIRVIDHAITVEESLFNAPINN